MNKYCHCLVFRLRNFIRKPWPGKIKTLRFKIRQLWGFIFPFVPLPIRLPFGVWWLIYNDVCSDIIFDGTFEQAGYQFVNCFLQPGMTVLDAGAHRGYYTLLAAKKVGPQGRVIAFEPSSRERKRLLLHLRINGCNNVQVQGVALGNDEGKADFFLVKGRNTVLNSLRHPKVNAPVSVTPVPVTKLDTCLYKYKIDHVDFIKMDIEGAELEALKGARELLEHRPRPIIYCEVADQRTERWGYKAKEIIMYLHYRDYCWFRPLSEGNLEPMSIDQEDFNSNFVAVPQERIEQIGRLLKSID